MAARTNYGWEKRMREIDKKKKKEEKRRKRRDRKGSAEEEPNPEQTDGPAPTE